MMQLSRTRKKCVIGFRFKVWLQLPEQFGS